VGALRLPSLGALHLVEGTVTTTGMQVLALSATNSNVVDVHPTLVRPWVGDVEQSLSHLVSAFSRLICQAVIKHLDFGDVLLLWDCPASFTSDMEKSAAMKGVVVEIMSPSTGGWDPAMFLAGSEQALQRKLTQFLHDRNITRAFCWQKSGAVAPTINKLVPFDSLDLYMTPNASQVSLDKLWRVSSSLDQALALSIASKVDLKSIKLVPAAKIAGEAFSSSDLVVIDWCTASTVPMTLEPVDARPLFVKDRSYWLVGLTGNLGLSLCRWMIAHGAKYIAVSSRNPKIDPRWLKGFEAAGATVNFYQKYYQPLSH
jgi:hybrid polyketide synthase/nonribosomal peptide synthetase ACE1